MYKLFFFIFTYLVLYSSGLSSKQSSENEVAKQELVQLKDKIKSLQTSLSKTRKKQSTALKQLRRAEKKIATASKILRSTLSQLNKKQRDLTKLHSQQEKLEQNKNVQKEALAEQLRSVYINGKQEYLKLLLNQKDPEKLGRMLVYYNYMNKARSDQVNALQSTINDLNNVDNRIQNEIQKLNLLKHSKESETKQLVKLQTKRQALVAKLSLQINFKSDELTELEINAQELQQLINSVRETIDEMDFSQPLEGLKQLKGKLRWPTKGKQIRRFGSKYQGQKSSGVLIASKVGNDINAVHHGRVVYADWLRGFGLLLILDHGKGYMSLYGYNQSLYKDVGDWVEAGEVIATLGQSGGQKVPGLYFELRHQGKPVNPKRWFR
ncbi:MAG: peptidoglycan DD-metalloendopeptidase family protein [Kangiellaceae bacterium]|nr:peptidoglycan DD-metalloendopeptidase family protein [Kangiellaceae bacterium]